MVASLETFSAEHTLPGELGTLGVQTDVDHAVGPVGALAAAADRGVLRPLCVLG